MLALETATVRRIPTTTREAQKSCSGPAGSAVAFCVLTTNAEDRLPIAGATGLFFESMYRAVEWRSGMPMGYAALLRVGERLSLISISPRGRQLYSPSGERSLFRLPDRQSEIIGLGHATRWSTNQPGIAACVRTNRELTDETAQGLWRELRALLGPKMTELRVRNDGWFLDEEFSLDPLTLCARNTSLPTAAELDARVWLLCSGSDEPNCLRLEGVRYRSKKK